ncbi:PIN domain-containing protein [Cephaloticoccus primus]|nr:type II toxin-antitoxin system VapC family toxin [Cephaloticoccus primus]
MNASNDKPPADAALDTNVAVRYLTADDPEQTAQAIQLIGESPPGSLYLDHLVIIEVIWVLRGRYKIPRQEVATAIQSLMEKPSVRISAHSRNAMERYSQTNLDFVDCWLAARACETGQFIASFDRDYRKFKDVIALPPLPLLERLKGRRLRGV